MEFASRVAILLCLAGCTLCLPSDKNNWENDSAVNNLRTYLRIPTVHPNVNYDEAINFLKGQAKELGLPYMVFDQNPKNPILLMSWEGLQPNLTSVLLNSHMDVVPVFEKNWIHPPFEAFMDKDGTIYGRGAQDMKSVGIQYLEAVRRLKASGIRLKRTLHLSFVPDEEVGGGKGMKRFVKSEFYKKLNVGFALDEGIASPDENYLVYFAERCIWPVEITCTGKSGHGSLLHDNTAGEKMRYIIDKFMDLRAENKKKLTGDRNLTVGDVTTINLTQLSGGVQSNVVPDMLKAVFDIRLALSVNHTEFDNMIKRWATEAGEGVTVKYIQKDPYSPPTKLDDSNPYWIAFKNVADELKLPLQQRVFPGGTDSRYIRDLHIPAIGFSPMSNTPVQLHEHNESLNAATFLKGIAIYEKIIPALANV